ncbi:disease resistance protein RPS2-like [Eucalyptus grandis]|uniref:disease resistance protein RPS2-like n=1 Tax=Eucalyptus grandis TaxID=71139 RepID=UPI00192E99B2|nr:disease resistance protein RPS2-like [Eucalyptus grandis]
MFTPTIAENLVALTKLRISNCRILIEVISDEKGGDGRVVAFNQLKYMELDGLIGLRSFSSGGYTLMFPLLEDIIVTRCPNMKFFSQGPTEASKLKRVQVSKEAWFWAGNLNITIQNMFEEMRKCCYRVPGLIGKWHNELNPIKLYWQLKSVVVDKCPSFINAIPSRLMLVLNNLGYLQVPDCKLLEEIFDLERLEAVESTRVLPQLWELNLVNLPKLRQLWNRDLQESIRFDSLATLILYNCSNLGHAFTSSMAQCLANLYRMEINECGQMEEVIVEEEGQGSTMDKITFLKLGQMKLEWLPNLACFLSTKNHTMECSNLQMLSINHCPKMRSLTGQSRMDNDHGTPAFFTSQVQFPKLWWMDLSHMDNLSKIWIDGPQETLTFDCLWKVEVRNCKSLENLFPYWVATSLTQLDKLQVESCEIEEIIASGDDTPRSNTTTDLFPKLNSLVLHDMPRLRSFCPNLPTLNWPLLEELRVTHCDELNMLSFVASMNSWAHRDDQHDLSDQEAHSSFERV